VATSEQFCDQQNNMGLQEDHPSWTRLNTCVCHLHKKIYLVPLTYYKLPVCFTCYVNAGNDLGTMTQYVSGIEDYHLFIDRYYSGVELAQKLDNQKCKYTSCFLTVCLCCTNFLGKTLHLVAWQAFKNP
jgi:hypothetical protein